MVIDGFLEEQVIVFFEIFIDRLCCFWLGCCVLIKFSSFYGDIFVIFVLGAFIICVSILFCDRQVQGSQDNESQWVLICYIFGG